jgi:hypothetical protein
MKPADQRQVMQQRQVQQPQVQYDAGSDAGADGT